MQILQILLFICCSLTHIPYLRATSIPKNPHQGWTTPGFSRSSC